MVRKRFYMRRHSQFANHRFSVPAVRTWATATLVLVTLASCTLRRGMKDVQLKYNALTEIAERSFHEPLLLSAGDRSRDLEAALLQPAVARDHALAAVPEFQELLTRTVEAVRDARTAATEVDPDSLWQARTRISYRCQECHDRFRK